MSLSLRTLTGIDQADFKTVLLDMGANVRIEHQSAPVSGSFEFNADFSAYGVLVLVAQGIAVTSDGSDIVMRFKVAGSEVSTGYLYSSYHLSSSGANSTDNSNTGTSLSLVNANGTAWGVGNAAAKSYGGTTLIFSPASTSVFKSIYSRGIAVGGTDSTMHILAGGTLANTAAINGLRIFSPEGNLTAGKVSLFGRK